MEARIHSGPLCGCVLCPIHQQSPLISAVTVSCTGTFHPTAVQHSAQVTKWKKKETLALNMPDRPCAAGKRRQEIRVTTDKSFPSRRKMRAETGARRRRGRGAASRSPARFSRRSDWRYSRCAIVPDGGGNELHKVKCSPLACLASWIMMHLREVAPLLCIPLYTGQNLSQAGVVLHMAITIISGSVYG